MNCAGLRASPVLSQHCLQQAGAADAPRMYRVTLDADGAAALGDLGVDLAETGYKPSVATAQPCSGVASA